MADGEAKFLLLEWDFTDKQGGETRMIDLYKFFCLLFSKAMLQKVCSAEEVSASPRSELAVQTLRFHISEPPTGI